MIYNVARVRRLFTKFQVDTCKTKKDTSAHAQLHTLQLRSKTWFIMWQDSWRYLQYFKLIHAKLKKDRSAHAQLGILLLRSKPWFIRQQESGGYKQSFKSIHAKMKMIALHICSCVPCSWNPSHDLWYRKGQEVIYKISSRYMQN